MKPKREKELLQALEIQELKFKHRQVERSYEEPEMSEREFNEAWWKLNQIIEIYPDVSIKCGYCGEELDDGSELDYLYPHCSCENICSSCLKEN